MRSIRSAHFSTPPEQGANFLLTVIDAVFSEGVANQKTLHRHIRSQFQSKRKIPFVATDHEISQGRNIAWILRTTPEALLREVPGPLER
ncbi:hypothetical protein [Synechococcus sp. BA-132 BA5]|uniref:hypothetical protein n=1 Tax=Synechococcus sp. BA-132 BA5 TaxID=3110252 RepID=UPI002B2117C9|nr:hypothetical protein [Synechococcus sp. BA-132 BA5]MEA5414019.1 hypothetical protein [Synechococcus sp. BA-132 BA5]